MQDFAAVVEDLANRLAAGEDPSALLDRALDLLAIVPPDQPALVQAADEVVMVLSQSTDGAAAAIRQVLDRLGAPPATEFLDSASTVVADGADPPSWLPDWVDADLLAEFAESQHAGMAELERIALLGAEATEQDEATVRRVLHTLKGESATVGFDGLASLFHTLEDTLEALGGAGANADLTLETKDGIIALVDRFIANPDPNLPVQDLIEKLEQATRSAPEPGPPPADTPEPPQPLADVPPPPMAPDPLEAPSMWTEPGSLASVLEFDPSDPEMVELFGEFYEEATESLLEADGLLLQLESEGPDEAAVNALFRTFHTIKGLSGFLDLSTMRELSHVTENLLDLARQRLDTLTPGRMDLLLQATATAKAVLEATRESLQSGKSAFPPPETAHLLKQLRAAAAPGWSDEPGSGGNLASAPETPAAAAPTPEPGPAQTLNPAPTESGKPAPGPPSAPAAQGTDNRKPAVTVRENIKVDLQRVDNLVEIIGELVIVEAMVANSAELHATSQRTRQQLAQLSKIVRALQRQGLALRMVPLRGVFQKMSRLVRDLSRRSAKNIKLSISGQDAEMDRGLADRLGDPLLHMIRNAVDHGIETPEERLAAGKPEAGTLRLAAYHEGGNIIIELSDDGRGLNREKILAKATQRGLVQPGEPLEDEEVWDLIFQPGFSTAEAVTEISGRGVGMDVVRRTVDELRGRIQIESKTGEGSRFRFILPLTLAIIDGMLMRCGGGRFVLPTLSIVESFQPDTSQLHRFASGHWLIEMRGQQLPLVDLGAVLGVASPSTDDPSSGLVVVIDGVGGRFGLVVDDVIGQQQVVIKQLDEAVNQNELFSGAAILSDGQVGLVLNPVALRSVKKRGRAASRRAAEV